MMKPGSIEIVGKRTRRPVAKRMDSLDHGATVRVTLGRILKIALPVSPESQFCCHLLRERFLSIFFQMTFRGLKIEIVQTRHFIPPGQTIEPASGECLRNEFITRVDPLVLSKVVAEPLADGGQTNIPKIGYPLTTRPRWPGGKVSTSGWEDLKPDSPEDPSCTSSRCTFNHM
ncbi:hypothetical protein AVEN_53357-1 [Araneus ventricosus]|uniref:Uncharacterized protein n=1 Tax=Araneus ventricosus TaxID=182803 RepID=A0A4Y2A9V6_ARAVE|nr:hypothetical protein AVEN_53357-1 [Araneus ventricosus]